VGEQEPADHERCPEGEEADVGRRLVGDASADVVKSEDVVVVCG
jgi:hypothetical protein